MTTKSDIDVAIEAILDKAAADARIAARARIVAQLASVTAKPAGSGISNATNNVLFGAGLIFFVLVILGLISVAVLL